jgi:hypothetical protein
MGVLTKSSIIPFIRALGGSWEFLQGPFYLLLAFIRTFLSTMLPLPHFVCFFPISTSVSRKSCQSMAQGLTNIVKKGFYPIFSMILILRNISKKRVSDRKKTKSA